MVWVAGLFRRTVKTTWVLFSRWLLPTTLALLARGYTNKSKVSEATWLSWVRPVRRKLSRVYWLTSGTSTWVFNCSGLSMGTSGPPVSICDHCVRLKMLLPSVLAGMAPCRFTSRLASLKISGPASILTSDAGLGSWGALTPRSAAAFCNSVCLRSDSCSGVTCALLVSTWLPWPLPQALNTKQNNRPIKWRAVGPDMGTSS